MHRVGEDGSAVLAAGGNAQRARQVVSVENVVAENQGATLSGDEVGAEEKRLRDALGRRLHDVAEVHAPARAVAQQLLEARRVKRRGDDEDVANARQHQHAERVVDHRLVVHRQQLLGDTLRRGIEARARTAGENDALERISAFAQIALPLRHWRCAAHIGCRSSRDSCHW